MGVRYHWHPRHQLLYAPRYRQHPSWNTAAGRNPLRAYGCPAPISTLSARAFLKREVADLLFRACFYCRICCKTGDSRILLTQSLVVFVHTLVHRSDCRTRLVTPCVSDQSV
jgi:hypothetical protein